MEKNLLLAFFLVSFALSANAQNVILTRETVAIRLDSAHVTVNGDYAFRNTVSREISQTMFFPLPVIRGDQKLDSVYLFDVTSNALVKSFRRLPAGLFYQLSFQPLQAKKIRLYYSYDHNGKEAVYLLMTHAKYWGMPVSQEEYSVSFDEQKISIDSISYKPEKTLVEQGITIHSWHKVNFMPDKELDVWFHRD